MKESHVFVFKQGRLEESAQHPSKPRKNYQKAEIWSRCFQHHEESPKKKSTSKAAGKLLFIMANFSHNIPSLFIKSKKRKVKHNF